MKKLMFFISVCIITLSSIVWGHGGAAGIIKERMDLMGSLKQSMKALKPIFRGQIAYDHDAIKMNALIIRDNAADHMIKLFPAGSLHKPSEATPDIWQNWDEFAAIAKDLERLGQALHSAADKPASQLMPENKSMMGMQKDTMMGSMPMMGSAKPNKLSDEQLANLPANQLFRMIGNTCSDCHTQFRADKKR